MVHVVHTLQCSSGWSRTGKRERWKKGEMGRRVVDGEMSDGLLIDLIEFP